MKKIYQVYKYDYDSFFPLGYYETLALAKKRLEDYTKEHIKNEKNTRDFLYKSYKTDPTKKFDDDFINHFKLKDITQEWDKNKLTVTFVGTNENNNLEEYYDIQEIIINQDLN